MQLQCFYNNSDSNIIYSCNLESRNCCRLWCHFVQEELGKLLMKVICEMGTLPHYTEILLCWKKWERRNFYISRLESSSY